MPTPASTSTDGAGALIRSAKVATRTAKNTRTRTSCTSRTKVPRPGFGVAEATADQTSRHPATRAGSARRQHLVGRSLDEFGRPRSPSSRGPGCAR